MSERPHRTTAEWTTLVVSFAVLAVVVGAIALQMRGDRTPAAPTAHVIEVMSVGDQFHVLVAVTNDGDETAANVQVTAELRIDGTTIAGDQTIDFLAGDEEEDLVFVFADDPGDGELDVAVTGFAIP